MNKAISVTKRDGSQEPLDLEKIHKVVSWACEGLSGTSPSEIELKSHVQFYDGIPTSVIHQMIVNAAANLISEETPKYQFAAGRLVAYGIRKEVYGSYTPTRLYDHIRKVADSGFYDPEIINSYSESEWDQIEANIDYTRDCNFTYAAMEQWRTKYLVRNRYTGKIFETPQVAYALIAATAFASEDPSIRMKLVTDFYHAVSTHRISLPTPIMAGLRTTQKQFSSCVLIETDDTLDSIVATSGAIVKYVSQKAGIGIGAGALRALGSPIRNGDATHTGVVPFFKHFYSAVNSCSQGGVRKGSATLYYPIWHLEVEDLIVLKNNKGTEETRIRHMDFGVQLSKLFYERLIQGSHITLFSPSDVPGLYEAFYADQEKFRDLYEKAERNTRLRKKKVPAIELFSLLMQERKDTGRIYIQNVDNANERGSFIPSRAPIRQSNLCAEITLPTVPLQDVNDPDGEIALCTLAASNIAAYNHPEEMQQDCALLVRMLDNVLTYQNYPVPAAKNATMGRRPLGIGVTNLAAWMAKHDIPYDGVTPEGLAEVDRWISQWSRYLIDASIDLAIERGPCPKYEDTKYSQGVVPVDVAAPGALELVPNRDDEQWRATRERLKKHGIRNSTLMAWMPCETSALISNSTNGAEPIRAFITSKKNKDMVVKQVAPGFPRIKNKYNLLWDQKSPEGYLKVLAIAQMYIDQGISVNTSYNPKFYPDEEIPMSALLKDLLLFYKLGGKQLYYCNTNDQAGELNVKEPTVVSEAVVEEDCDSCKL